MWLGGKAGGGGFGVGQAGYAELWGGGRSFGGRSRKLEPGKVGVG